MKKFFLFIPFLLFADVDPFNAGNLNSPNPYGLTPTEKAILKNKKEIKKNENSIDEIKRELKKIKDDLDSKLVMYDETLNDLKDKTSSINTLIDEVNNLNNEIIGLKKRIFFIENNISSLENNLSVLNDKYDKLKITIHEIVKIQNENFKYLTDSIQNLLEQIKNQNLSPKKAFNKARELYFSNKLNKAKQLFLIALNNNYLPATSSYYLGEIAYKERNYKEALAYYKKSITLYPKKTSFTAKLLYHTGISFEKLGMNKNAKLTFEKLIKDFKNSKYAKLAKKELEKIK
jgi:TolA-binding protein